MGLEPKLCGPPILQFSVGKAVHAARFHAGVGALAVGGPEHDLSLWDVETGVPTFQARNVPNTTLDLRVPVWVSALQFLPAAGAQQAAERASTSAARTDASPHILALASRHRHVRLYDVRAGRRPGLSVELGEYPFTALDVSADGLSLLAGDSIGTLRRLDLRASLRQTSTYKGAGGCVRSLAVSAAQPYFASAGLDRCLHVHHVETRAQLRRVYLKQCLTAVLLVPAEARGGDEGRSGGGAAAELAPEPPPDTRVRITYSRGAALRPVAAAVPEAGADDDDAVWEELDRRAIAAASASSAAAGGGDGGGMADGVVYDAATASGRVAGTKHRREVVEVEVGGASDDESAESFGEDGADDDLEGLDDSEGEEDGSDIEEEDEDDEDDDGDLDDGDDDAEPRELKAAKSNRSMRDEDDFEDGGAAGAWEEDDDPLVSSQAVAKSLRKEVDAARRAAERASGGGGTAAGRRASGTGGQGGAPVSAADRWSGSQQKRR